MMRGVTTVLPSVIDRERQGAPGPRNVRRQECCRRGREVLTWTQDYDPLRNIVLSALVAGIPLIFVVFGLAVLKWRASTVTLAAFGLAVIVAAAAFQMPLRLLCLAAALGLTQALILTLILIGAIAFQHVLTITGRFNLLRRAIMRVTPDPRLQLIFISFCYGSLLEAIAGGGTPVLITVSMLVGLGFNGFQAARNSLLANSTPVAFGAVGLPFVYMALVTG